MKFKRANAKWSFVKNRLFDKISADSGRLKKNYPIITLFNLNLLTNNNDILTSLPPAAFFHVNPTITLHKLTWTTLYQI